jgi:hypothetical protein
MEHKLESSLLHDRNVKPSTPVVHSVAEKESLKSMSFLPNGITCSKHCWQICGVLLLGLQKGCTKFSYFIFVICMTVEKPINVTLWMTGQKYKNLFPNLKNLLLPPTTHKFGADEPWWKPWKKCEVSCIRMVKFQISMIRRLSKEYLSAYKL